MTEKTLRRPVRNFFIKKRMQLSIIGRVLFIVLVTTVLTIVLLGFIYNAKSQAGSFYYMSNNIMEDLKLQSILGLVLPAVIAAQVISLLISLGIGFFSSRKAAVPIYKIEKWAAQLKSGNLKTHLAFRENKEMQDLTDQCNGVTEAYHGMFAGIKRSVAEIERDSGDAQKVAAELQTLNRILQKLQTD